MTATDVIDLVYYEIALDKVDQNSLQTLKEHVKHFLDENPRLNFVS